VQASQRATCLPRAYAALAFVLSVVAGDAGAQAPGNAAAPSSGGAPASEPKGNFLSSLKQAFRQDYDHEVIRGHFEVGSAPDVHRYYCLVDPKTGKSESNGVAGTPYRRPDGMTGIKGAAVAFYSCSDAEQRGTLVTDGYSLAGVSARIVPPAPLPKPTANPAAPVAAAEAPAAKETTAQTAKDTAAQAAKETAAQMEVMAAYNRFIVGQNAHDRAAVSELLLDSKDLVWAGPDGSSIWGHEQTLAALEQEWQGTWKLEPQTQEPRIASISSTVAVVVSPMHLMQRAGPERVSVVPVRWAAVFVKTRAGWRISSIFMSAYKDGSTPEG